MEKPVVFKATFSSAKPVRGRRVLALTFEVPLEKGDQALEILGGVRGLIEENTWVAIARVKEAD